MIRFTYTFLYNFLRVQNYSINLFFCLLHLFYMIIIMTNHFVLLNSPPSHHNCELLWLAWWRCFDLSRGLWLCAIMTIYACRLAYIAHSSHQLVASYEFWFDVKHENCRFFFTGIKIQLKEAELRWISVISQWSLTMVVWMSMAI